MYFNLTGIFTWPLNECPTKTSRPSTHEGGGAESIVAGARLEVLAEPVHEPSSVLSSKAFPL